MIPMRYINEWRDYAPWQSSDYVEQDLVISRALVELFRVPQLQKSLAFRGGTAINKLFFKPATRYSEDIDLVQIKAEPIGQTFDAIRQALDPWLGEPKRVIKDGRANLYYRFQSEENSEVGMRLKVEINTREHFSVYENKHIEFEVKNDWFDGNASITTYSFNELLATKLRALYSRKKGRDLYDLFLAMDHDKFDLASLLYAFEKYMAHEGRKVTRAQFEENIFGKMKDRIFLADIGPLLRNNSEFDAVSACELFLENVIAQLPGEAWAGNDQHSIMS